MAPGFFVLENSKEPKIRSSAGPNRATFSKKNNKKLAILPGLHYEFPRHLDYYDNQRPKTSLSFLMSTLGGPLMHRFLFLIAIFGTAPIVSAAPILVMIWNDPAGTANANLDASTGQRVLSYNPITGHVIYVSRVSGVTTLNRLDGATGAVITPALSVPSAVVAGGALTLNASGVSDDGVIYACNVQTAPSGVSPIKIYRWSSEDPAVTPTVAFAGDPGNSGAGRWGDMIIVRGSGPNTQILMGSDGSNVALFRTTDGINFTSQKLAISGGTADYQGGLAFGGPNTNTFWGRRNAAGTPMYRVTFDPIEGTAHTVYTNAVYSSTATVIGIAFDPATSLFAAMTRQSSGTILPHTNFLYIVGADLNAFTLQDLKPTPTAITDGGSAQSSGSAARN